MDETKLHTVALIRIYEHLIKSHKFLIELGSEVAALRETVAGLDPTFPEVMNEKRQSLESLNSGRLAEDLKVLEMNLELLKGLFSS